MGKTICFAVLSMVLLSFNSFGKEASPGTLVKPAPVLAAAAPAQVTLSAENSGAAKWVLIGIDAVLAGISVYMVADERKAADDYTKLFNSIDNTSADNYQALKDKKSAGENKAMGAGVVSGITGFFLAYTAADMFWFHMAFTQDVKTVFIPEKQEIKITWSREF